MVCRSEILYSRNGKVVRADKKIRLGRTSRFFFRWDQVTFVSNQFSHDAKDLGEGLHICERQRTLLSFRTESGKEVFWHCLFASCVKGNYDQIESYPVLCEKFSGIVWIEQTLHISERVALLDCQCAHIIMADFNGELVILSVFK